MKRCLLMWILIFILCFSGCSLLSGSLRTNDYLVNTWHEKLDKDKLIYDYSICNYTGSCTLYAVYDASDGYEYEFEFNGSNIKFDQSNYSLHSPIKTTEFIVFLKEYLKDYDCGGLNFVPEEHRINFEADNYLWKCKQMDNHCLLVVYDRMLEKIYYYISY